MRQRVRGTAESPERSEDLKRRPDSNAAFLGRVGGTP